MSVQVVSRDTFTQEHLLRLFTSAPGAFWRHDIDVSLSAAAKMARFAKLAGVQCTFYLMARSEFYNPFSDEGEDAVAEIIEAGHRIGLHVDYRSGSVTEAVDRDRLLMIAGGYSDVVDPLLVSFHMPPRRVLWSDFPGFTNAYASEWEGRYVSDSRRQWTEEKTALVGDGMQINLHAEHWFPCA